MPRDAMRFYCEYLATAPEEVNAYFAFHMLPPAPFVPEQLHFQRVCMIVACSPAAPERAEELLAPLRQFGPPLVDMFTRMPLPALNTIFDALLPPGLYHNWKAHFVTELTDEAIEAHVTHAARMPTFQSGMHMYPIDGAARRVGEDETAFSHRTANWIVNIVGVGPDPEGVTARTQFVRDYWDALQPYSDTGAYINFLGEEGEERIRASYGTGYDRLRTVKRAYDPDNLFHLNQNIKPVI